MKILSRVLQLTRLKFSLMLASSHKCGDLSLFSIYRSCKMYSLMAGDSLVTLCSGSANVQSNFPRTYQVVVAATRDMGIGKDGKLPWKLPSDLKFFKELTSTTSDHGKKNAVLMGRKTWESIPPHSRPLPGRLNVVLTRSGGFNVASAENVITCGSISSALELLASTPYCLLIDKVFVIGGGQILREALNGPGCVAVHMTEINASIDCDTFITPVHDSVFRPWYSSPPLVENSIRYCFVTYVRAQRSAIESVASSIGVKYNNNSDSNKVKVEDFTFLPKMIFEKHDEFMYLKLVQDVISGSTQKDDPSGTRTLSKFGCQMHFNLRKTFPLLTTKRVSWRNVVEEFLCFIRGSTNAKVLQEKDIQIRDGNATGDCHESIGSGQCNESDSGSIDGFQSRHFGASVQGFDQLLEIINKVKNKPDDGRIILSAWNPSDLSLMALPPCHMFAQFYVANGEVSCQMYQASADIGLGVPFTIASYALLTCMVAHVSGLVPGDFIHVIGDVHVNKTHIRPLQQQLEKPPRPFPSLHINPEKQDVDSFVAADFKLVGYDPHEGI